jgi:nicotinamide mononucleotide transporter
MTKKKLESWYWWIAANLTSLTLYFVKNFIFTASYYCLLIIIAILCLKEWKKRSLKKIAFIG